MPTERELLLAGKSLDEVADVMSGCEPGSHKDQMVRAEFLLRQTDYLRQQTEHQKVAAESAMKTAGSTKQYTRYMLWSVVILTLSAFGSFAIAWLGYLKQ